MIGISLALTQWRSVAAAGGGYTADAVGPGASWDGTAGSGFSSPPSDPARSTAKPAARLLVPYGQRFAADLDIVVDADALGGISYVNFYVESDTPVQVSSATLNAYADVNGNTVAPDGGTLAMPGYKITLDHSAFIAQSASGNTIQVYIEAVPADTSMQSRVIGPYLFYPESAANDASYTVAASGADYTTIAAALDAAKAASKLAPLITLTQTGYYELSNGTGLDYTGGKGFAVITAANGVTATLRKATLDTAAPSWDPRYDGIELRGDGIVIDQRNLTIFEVSSLTTGRGHWLNGIRVTNSENTSETIYWNKGNRPSIGILATPTSYGGQAGGFITDCVLEYGSAHLTNLSLARNNALLDPIERFINGTVAAIGNYANRTGTQWFRDPINTFTVAYSGAGTATLVKTGNNGVGTVALKVDGVTVAGPYTLGQVPTDTYYDMSDLVAQMDADTSADWTFTTDAGVDTRGARYISPRSALVVIAFTTTITSTPVQFCSMIDIHSGGWNVNANMENAILRNNKIPSVDYEGTDNFSAFLLDDNVYCRDVIMSGQIFGGNGLAARYKSKCTVSHMVVDNCHFFGGIRFQSDSAYNIDAYSVIRQCVLDSVTASVNATYNPTGALPSYPARIDNCVKTSFTAGTNDSGNFTAANLAAAVFTDAANGDYRPTGTLLTNKKTRLRLLDGRNNDRASTDAVGPWADGYSAPSYYNFTPPALLSSTAIKLSSSTRKLSETA
jgi:hypothetical protein